MDNLTPYLPLIMGLMWSHSCEGEEYIVQHIMLEYVCTMPLPKMKIKTAVLAVLLFQLCYT